MRRLFRILMLPLVIAGLVLLGWWLLKDVQMDVLAPSGEIATKQRNLLLFTVILSASVVVPVFTLLAVISIRYRDTNTKAAYRPNWGENRKLEIVWWGIPIAIISVLAVVTWFTSHSLDPYKKIASSNPPVNVQVVALQWKWLFLYPDYGIATVNQLPVPVDTPLSFTLSADAPMSAFWIPSLGSQIYTMNGMSSQLNLLANHTGDYKGYSTNINGRGYSDMTFMVHAMQRKQFASYVEHIQGLRADMTQAQYAKLAAPSVQKGETAYRLTHTDLYDTIVQKYMGNTPMHYQNASHSHMEATE